MKLQEVTSIVGLAVLILVGINAWHTLQDRKAKQSV